jgi:hypothetical protein
MVSDKLCLSFVIFILSNLLLLGCASAQCGDCDDKNPCTKDDCDGILCQHIPQSCDERSSFPWSSLESGSYNGTTDKSGILRQNNQEPFVSEGAINTSASCDDNNPCTRDSYGANGCVHDPVNCDDGNPCTSDYCGANGCVHDPVNCDDGNPCTSDYCGANGCVHDPVNCDDGNTSTTDLCGPSGCVNTPLLGESDNAYSVKLLSPVITEMQNENTTENTTTNESKSVIEEATVQLICDDGNPCTTNSFNGTGCVYALINCDDGNESTLDSCRDGTCINEPIDSGSILSENNSTAVSSSEALMAGNRYSCDDHDPCTVDTFSGTKCEHKPKICDDGKANTFDYCFEGVCYNTTTSCDDGNNCTIDSYNGTACVHRPKSCDDHNACTIDTCDNGKCVHTPKNCNDGNPCTYDECDRRIGCYNPWKCDDGNPCTIDYCDSVWGCIHSPVVCGQGKTCINGVCQYLYYPYVAPSSSLPSAQSYVIPAGTAITLPWGQVATALNSLKVENGIAYSSASPSASPLRFVRLLGLENQAISGYQSGLPISERAEMIGLSWKDARFNLNLIQPNGSILPVQGGNRNVVHLVGTNYDYYFLRNAAIGNWSIEIRPLNPGTNGVGFSLITGLVKGAAPINQP